MVEIVEAHLDGNRNCFPVQPYIFYATFSPCLYKSTKAALFCREIPLKETN